LLFFFHEGKMELLKKKKKEAHEVKSCGLLAGMAVRGTMNI